MNGMALGAIAIGAVFLYSGIKGKGVLNSIQAIVQGKAPSTTPKENQIKETAVAPSETSTNPSGALPGAASSDISAIALQDVGHAYLYGGAPGIDGKSPWDCSSACNWWVGKRAGFGIPGYAPGTYNGTVHGPATPSWFFFGETVSGLQNAMPGDVIVWQTHMGIYIGNGQMVSALNPSLGTLVTTVQEAAPFGEIMTIRRMTA